jgi:hypothetical protein
VERAKAISILSASVDYYERRLSAGEHALGSERYNDAIAGVAAFRDPKSAASRFRDYRAKTHIENDYSFLGAYKAAYAYYKGVPEPPSLTVWPDDMNGVVSSFSDWAWIAADWQIRLRTTDQLRAAETQLEIKLSKARLDITRLGLGT